MNETSNYNFEIKNWKDSFYKILSENKKENIVGQCSCLPGAKQNI